MRRPWQPVEGRRRTIDIAVTCVLLGLALIGTLVGVLTTVEFPYALSQQYARYHVAYTPHPELAQIGAAVAVSHVLLFLAALCVSIPLMRSNRGAIFVPLVAGAIASIIFWSVLFSVFLGDQRLMHAVSVAH
jgi:Family of unknown function (DUF6264)